MSDTIYTPDANGRIEIDLHDVVVTNSQGWPHRTEAFVTLLQGTPTVGRPVLQDPESGLTAELGYFQLSRPIQVGPDGSPKVGQVKAFPTAGRMIVTIDDFAIKPLEWCFANGRVRERLTFRRGEG